MSYLLTVTRAIECNAQRDDDEFLELFRKQASLAPQDFWSRYLYDLSPSRHYQKWKHGRALDRYVGRIVDERFSNGPTAAPEGDKRKYYAVDAAIETSNSRKKVSANSVRRLDKETRDMLITSVKTLIFAGHDTSASTLCVSLSMRNR